MKRDKFFIIIMSCLIGLIASAAYLSKIRHLRDEIARMAERVSVLTVSRDMKAGEVLDPLDLEEKLVLEEQVSSRAISPEDREFITGRLLIHPVPAHDLILWTDFSEGPRLRNPSERIPPGFRVIALPADEIHTLVHFISPGDAVDIVSSTFESSDDKLVSRPIAENVIVMAVGQRFKGWTDGGGTEEYPLSVSLAVEPDTALRILRASQVGEVHFLARGSSPFPQLIDPKKLSTPSVSLPGAKP